MIQSISLSSLLSSLILINVVFAQTSCAKATLQKIDNPGVIEINNPAMYEKVVALSDIHGMYTQVKTLLKSGGVINSAGTWAAGETLLIVNGDSIDKGPDSVEVLKLFIKLSKDAKAQGGKVIHLLGNHEAEFLANPQNSKAKEFRQEIKDKDLKLKDFTEPGRTYADYLYSMPVAAKVGKWLFCHSGLLPDKNWDKFILKARKNINERDYSAQFFLAPDSILEAGDWWKTNQGRKDLKQRLSDNGLFGVVFGHRGGALEAEGRNAVSDDHRLVKIDNTMVPDQEGGTSNPGSLLIFPKPSEMTANSAPQILTLPSGGKAEILTP